MRGRDEGGLTLREIAREVGCSPSTVWEDIKTIKRGWAARRVENATEALDGQLAELRRARRVAWETEAPDSVVRNLEREAKLLGLEPTPPDTVPVAAVQALAEQLAAVALAFVPEEQRDALRAAIAQVPLRS